MVKCNQTKKEKDFKVKLDEWGYKKGIEIEINYMVDRKGNIILDTDSMEDNFNFCIDEVIRIAKAVNRKCKK